MTDDAAHKRYLLSKLARERLNGKRSADGSLVMQVNQPQEPPPVLPPVVVNDAGDRAADGTIYAGLSPSRGAPMYALPQDHEMRMGFNQAAAYARKLNEDKMLGHSDWRVPTETELDQLYRNRDKGAFKDTFTMEARGYWSSTSYDDDHYANSQRFDTGRQGTGNKSDLLFVRFVR